MFEQFELRHIPPLFIATATTFGGMMPLWSAERAIKEFGFPERIAVAKAAHPVMAVGSARVSVIGIALWGLYFGGRFEAMDIVLASIGWLALVDGYVCFQEGVKGKAVFRATSAGLVSLWGLMGMTSGK